MHLCEKNCDSWLKYYYYGWLDHIFGASDQSICEKKDFASCEVSNRYRHRKDQSDSGFQDCVFVEVQSWLKEDGPVSPVC